MIDLHQDIVMSHRNRESRVAPFPSGDLAYNAGNQQQYSEIDLVLGAIRAYRFVGDPLDVQGREIVPEPERITEYIHMYHDIFGDAIVLDRAAMETSRGDDPQVIIHIEGYDSLEETDTIRQWYEMGVRSFGFSRNFDNSLVGCASTDGPGLTDLGRESVQLMNDLGMIIDVAHMSHHGMMDVIQLSTQPIINSHSNVYAIHPHRRNARDEFLSLLPENGGVIGLTLYNGFVGENIDQTTIDDRCRHVEYLVDLIGSEHIAIGTDYHGIPRTRAIQGYDRVDHLAKLSEVITDRRGSTIAQRIMHSNARRVIESIL